MKNELNYTDSTANNEQPTPIAELPVAEADLVEAAERAEAEANLIKTMAELTMYEVAQDNREKQAAEHARYQMEAKLRVGEIVGRIARSPELVLRPRRTGPLSNRANRKTNRGL